jgi:ribonuclease D
VRELNIPRRWLAEDAILVDLSNVKPKTADHLQSFRGLHKGELKKNPTAILEAIRLGSADQSIVPPKREVEESLSDEQLAGVKLLESWISYLANQHEIATRHLIVQNRIMDLIRTPVQSQEDLWQMGFFSKGAADLIGASVFNLLVGKVQLTLDNGRLKIVEV